VHSEGGLGDAIQMVRYVSMLEKYEAGMILESPPELERLFRGLPGVQEVVVRGKNLPNFDYHIPSMEFPRIFGTTVKSVPARVPYLSAPVTSNGSFKKQVPKEDGLNVGLIWAGSDRPGDPRSRSISVFTPLMAVPNVRFFSLQKGTEAGQLMSFGFHVTDLTPQLSDMADTAALVAELDLVISVDTSVAHLAAAMGKPVWMLAPCRADPRWLVSRTDSPWYPTMRIFRAPRPGDWGTPVGQMMGELARMMPR
jgi:hypothetical protein